MIIPFFLPVSGYPDAYEPYIEPEDVLEGYELALYHDREGSQEVTAPSYRRIRFRPGQNYFPKATENWGTIQTWRLFKPDGIESLWQMPPKSICKSDTVCITHF